MIQTKGEPSLLTSQYEIMKIYKNMKRHKGSGKTIVATAKRLSKTISYMLKNDILFDPNSILLK